MSDDERQLIGISKIARHQVIERLKHAYANDHLEEAEFEQRLDLATNTRDRSILKELIDDLPEAIDGKPDRAPQSSTFHVGASGVKETGTIVSVFSGVTRKGDWHPPRHLKVISTMGGVDLDFTHATIPPEGVLIDVVCVMGGIDLFVPEGINVDAHPLTILGGVDIRGLRDYGPQAPTIRVRGIVFMGGLDIKPPRKERFKKFIKKIFGDE